MKNVRITPPKPKEHKKIRVAAYCRVSTFGPEQMRNLEIQRKTYLEMIKSHPNWIYAGVFYDIESGLRRSVRKSLDKLLKKAAKGKLITLSQSQCKTNLSKLSFIMKELRAYALENHVN